MSRDDIGMECEPGAPDWWSGAGDSNVPGGKWLDRIVSQAVLAEREACAAIAQATVCDTHIPTGIKIYGTRAAAAIRARSKP